MGDTVIAIIVYVVFMFFMLAIGGLGLVNYVLTSLSLTSIAEDRRIKNPWLAWLPLGGSWIIGSISDYHDSLQGQSRKWRVVLLVLELAFYATYFIGLIGMVAFFIFVLTTGEDAFMYHETELVGGMLVGFILMYGLLIVSMAVAVSWSMCRMVCIYKIFEALVPQKAVKYLLLGLIVPLAMAICLMKIKDSPVGVPQAFVPAPAPLPTELDQAAE